MTVKVWGEQVISLFTMGNLTCGNVGCAIAASIAAVCES